MNRRVVRDMLTVAGLDMAEATNAGAGLAMIDADEYDIVLMDLRMPGMDGLTAIRHIRARADPKGQVPIIVITADTGIDLHRTCLATGADQVLPKPVAMNSLFDALGDAASRNGLIIN